MTGRTRIRDLGITIGSLPTGPQNAITDVPGVLVGHCTLIADEPRVARTGVTVIVPRDGDIWHDSAFAGYFSFNGCGEMTGLSWLEESGLLQSPIGLTNTNAVGTVRDALVAREAEDWDSNGSLPIAAETWDGWLNDINAFHITKTHVDTALRAAHSGPVEEGNVGGGTGMICHEFKGGIGTSSRIVSCPAGNYTIGVLVQANYGDRAQLRIDGVPVGRAIGPAQVPTTYHTPMSGGSIIVIIATDAPLLPVQCKRLARRATVGLARVGGTGHNGSGDLFLSFATGNHLPILQGGTSPQVQNKLFQLQMLPHQQLDPFFDATADAVEESILNALAAAETMTGYKGHTAYALPLDEVQRLVQKAHP
jgi:D-aminopeptidase